MITPFKKPSGGELLDWQKEFNTQVNKIRYIIEQVIANFKTWAEGNGFVAAREPAITVVCIPGVVETRNKTFDVFHW